MAYKTINPYTNELVKTYPNHDDAYVEKTLSKADALYHQWRNQPVKERTVLLQAVSDYFTAHTDELAKVLTIDMGKRLSEAKGEVAICAAIAQYYADHGEEMLQPQTIKSSAGEAREEKHPVGTLMMVEPWNFPYYQLMRVFAPNFAVGNPVVYKHASNTPASAAAFEEAVCNAGVPDGSCTNLFISYDQVSNVIADKRIHGVALTGSERAGKKVAAEAGQNLKKSTLELGGSDAFIVAEDANLEEVNKVATSARLYNAGQVCTSSKRFIITENHYDEFLAALKKSFAQVKWGDPMDDATTLAPLCTVSAKEKLQAQVDDAIANGATLEYGNQPIDHPGNFFEPTILTNITRDNPAYFTEFFGPVAQVYKVKDDAAAIKLANDSDYGLGGVVFAGNPKHGAEIASQIETGQVFVNTYFGTLPELPFGGVKNSGYGRELGHLGINEFVNNELVVVNPEPKVDFENTFGGFV
ncbi:NAD-dependent succinate-semialdehyde dehydrogenase [Loigolactobacillus backii]|uniref:NAD-dependent succinate-semialdehyde dehydrogenase n=1 Tax=Loigolactobacillus backii TaxID=375175 RepID=UPI0007F0F01A|nr:NAD-dependent succinate-semialdehyde dehydrogenase [Loigolactobacillus backii]ANK67263.1 succinate-semialdehyde dehydrogenase [Loigolactobacillus backii]OLF70214.1 succinate-semialdehyde dehydrogenase [Loigolactobacillus backii]PIO87992.1 succinate-semialdehyde dehydrogenase [Loigolactobacillus backii]